MLLLPHRPVYQPKGILLLFQGFKIRKPVKRPIASGTTNNAGTRSTTPIFNKNPVRYHHEPSRTSCPLDSFNFLPKLILYEKYD